MAVDFIIEKDAAQYISKRGDAVVIGLKLEPSTGGCPCATASVTGTYIPTLSLGSPAAADSEQYLTQSVENIKVYFPAALSTRHGSTDIRIRLRGLLGLHWLELDGAKSISIHS